MAKKQTPKFLITYLCTKCGFDFAMTDGDEPQYFFCESKEDWSILKKQKFSWKRVAERLKLCNDRMMEALGGAYRANQEEKQVAEVELLEVLAKGQRLQRGIAGLEIEEQGRAKEKSPRPKDSAQQS